MDQGGFACAVCRMALWASQVNYASAWPGRLRSVRKAQGQSMSGSEPEQNGANPILRCENLSRRWGGLLAVNQVSLAFWRGEV
ncbi:MAG: hypothetical protein EBX61_10300, partial [Betaproteobacteria bacterium]|nr:hypothetical protein [Betaproteobacteria bacterium]